MFFVIIKSDFITDYLNVPAFTSEFLVRALFSTGGALVSWIPGIGHALSSIFFFLNYEP
jgi:hypothetical protein